jgi:hypothetical protein
MRRAVGLHELGDFFGRRREADEIEVDSADEGFGVGGG